MPSSKLPIILLCGAAGSGKDTVGAYLADNFGAVLVSQADPMKRFAQKVFGFTDQQLWGPSEFRNAADPATHDLACRLRIAGTFAEVLRENEVLDQVISRTKDREDLLGRWFDGIYAKMKAGPVSPRLVLQTFGTEFGREIDPNMWSQYSIVTSRQLVHGGWDYSRTQGLYLRPGFGGYPFVGILDGRFRNEILNVKSEGGITILLTRPAHDGKADIGGVKGHASEVQLDGTPTHFFDFILPNDKTIQSLQNKVFVTMDQVYGYKH